MRLLIDTHVVFWSTMELARLSQAARAALESEQNDVLVSVASAWEIAIKVGLGKWPEARDLLLDFERHMHDAGFEVLPITVAHARTAGLMGAAHRDPFDRVLAAQATMEGLVRYGRPQSRSPRRCVHLVARSWAKANSKCL